MVFSNHHCYIIAIMKRRQILKNAALGTASAAVVSACSPSSTVDGTAASLPQVQWNMATSWPESLDTLYGGAVTVCDRVAAITGGRFTITPYAAGEIVPPLQVLDAVQAGTVQCGHTAPFYYVGKNPAFAFGTALPFGFTAQQQNAWLYHGGGLEALQNLASDFSIINFPAGNTGVQMGGWFKRKVASVNDLKGLRMRIPGLGGEVMARLGVNVQVLGGGEIFLALDRGAIDAAEWVGPYDDEKLGFNKAAQFYYYPGWWEPGATLELQINLGAWGQLPKEYQEALKTAAYQANINMLAEYDALNSPALKRLLASGTQLVPYTEEIMAAAETAAFELYEENAQKDATFKAIYEPWKAFRQEIYEWHGISELSFLRRI